MYFDFTIYLNKVAASEALEVLLTLKGLLKSPYLQYFFRQRILLNRYFQELSNKGFYSGEAQCHLELKCDFFLVMNSLY